MHLAKDGEAHRQLLSRELPAINTYQVELLRGTWRRLALLVLIAIAPYTADAALAHAHVRFAAVNQRRNIPPSCSARADAERTRLNAIFKACGEGRSIQKEELAEIRAVGGKRSDRYGEITPKGLTTLGTSMGLVESDVFADLGSGLGRACSQAVGEFNVRTAVGVELSATRHALAVQARDALSDRGESATAERVQLVCGDCADKRVWASEASGASSGDLEGGGALAETTAVWMCSELFNNDLMARLARRITSSGKVRTVATLRRFPDGLDGYRRRATPVRAEMSWTAALSNPEAFGAEDVYDGAPVHIYDRCEVPEDGAAAGAEM